MVEALTRIHSTCRWSFEPACAGMRRRAGKILADAAHPGLHVEPTMLDAARKAVELAA